jgi:Flp pilus assembly protein TadG
MAMLRRFLRCDSGSIAIVSAIVLPVLVGFATLGIEAGNWYRVGRAMQGAADAAAMSAAASYLAGESNYTTVGETYGTLNGFTTGNPCGAASPCNVTVVVNPINAQNQIIVDIAQVQSPMLVPIAVHTTPAPCGSVSTIRVCVKAHAAIAIKSTSTGGTGCLIGLSKTQIALTVAGNGNINAPTCIAASDTCGGQTAAQCPLAGFNLNGGGQVNLAELDVATQSPFVCPAGTAGSTCNIAAITTTYPLWTLDPYAPFVMPNPGACPASDPVPTTSATGVTVYLPGTYCHGISVSSGSSVVIFSPGIYFVGSNNSGVASSFSITGGAINQITVATTPAPAISAGGTNYKKNDVLQVLGGTALVATTIKVNSVNGKTGAITGFTLTSGAYTVAPTTNPVSVSGSITGTGATFDLTFTNSAANAVTFVLTSPTGANVGSVQIKNAAVTLTSPSSGATKGLVFWQDCYPKATTCLPSAGAIFNGNGSAATTMLLNGTVYIPHQTVTVAGNSTFLPADCTAIVANIIDFQGQGTISKGCLPIGGGGTGGSGTFRLAQ